MTRPRTLLFAALAIGAGGCALTSKGDTLDPHFFTPELATVRVAPADPKAPRGALRLGRVRGAASIKEKMIFRTSDYEVGYDEERRWTEKPDVYLRRALAQALFEGGGFAQTAATAGPTLDADLFAFEEVRGPRPYVRVGVTIALHDEDATYLEKTLIVDEPIEARDADPPTTTLVRAFARALGAVVARTLDETTRGTAGLAQASQRQKERGAQ